LSAARIVENLDLAFGRLLRPLWVRLAGTCVYTEAKDRQGHTRCTRGRNALHLDAPYLIGNWETAKQTLRD
jgi:hypothetical protein